MRPSIFVSAEKIPGLRCVDEVLRHIRSGHAKRLFDSIKRVADREADLHPFVPTSRFPGRSDIDADHANRDYAIVHRSGTRVLRAALMNLLTGDPTYRDDALRQMESLFDASQWPVWCDLAHKGMNIDLRAGQLSRSLSLAYDWLHPGIDAAQRRWIVEGIDRCGIQPFRQDVANKVAWANGTNNWMTCVVGGHGIAGLALGDDHPQSRELVDYAHPRLNGYFDQYGPEGEFNESVAYANAHALPILYFSAHRYATGGGENRLARFPIPDTCRWLMYFTTPPGHVVTFGDAHIGRRPAASMFATVADATRDPQLQWFYLEHTDPDDPSTDPWELLWYDPELEPQDPRMPLGRAYHAHSANISSRTDWNPRSTATVVYAKAGHGAERHGNHDAGQVCIDGFGERLIVDPGSPPGYPGDFFGQNRYRYYNASVSGHNVLTFDGAEMRLAEGDRARIVESEFDDRLGGWWTIDLTGLYDGVEQVYRTVVHLLPSTVVVYDSAELENEATVSLRWHTVTEPELKAPSFGVRGEASSVCCFVTPLDAVVAEQKIRRHEYVAPYDRHRLGDPLEQVNEPYVETSFKSTRARVLSLFQVFGQPVVDVAWRVEGDLFGIDDGRHGVTVCCRENLVVESGNRCWEITASADTSGLSDRVLSPAFQEGPCFP